ncbi:UNVERIFIED_CONTAM: alpha/beta hydrolase [Microbacterium sp. SLM126]
MNARAPIRAVNFGETPIDTIFDLRGFNLSSKPASPDAYKPKLLVEDLVQFIRVLGYERCVIVAHDWGGAVCWNLAAQRPDLVERLVIINSPHPYLFARALSAEAR